MTLERVLAHVRRRGLMLSVSGDKLIWEVDASPPDSLLELIREHKPALIKHPLAGQFPNLRDGDIVDKIDYLSDLIETHRGDSRIGFWRTWRAHFEAVLRTRSPPESPAVLTIGTHLSYS